MGIWEIWYIDKLLQKKQHIFSSTPFSPCCGWKWCHLGGQPAVRRAAVCPPAASVCPTPCTEHHRCQRRAAGKSCRRTPPHSRHLRGHQSDRDRGKGKRVCFLFEGWVKTFFVCLFTRRTTKHRHTDNEVTGLRKTAGQWWNRWWRSASDWYTEGACGRWVWPWLSHCREDVAC